MDYSDTSPSTASSVCPVMQVGHVKTIIILTGGCMFFGDQMPPKKLVGVAVAMVSLISTYRVAT
jgi:hypothetical protein